MARLSSLSEEQKSFPELTLLQKYDAVLDVLFDTSGKSPTLDSISGELLVRKKKVHWGEILDILNTMNGDGYLYNNYTNDKNEQIFLLSFSGKLLKESGGLEKKIEREKEKEGLALIQQMASIEAVSWSKGNIIIALLISVTTLSVLLFTCNRDTNRYHKESVQQSKGKQQQEEILQSVKEVKEKLHRISLSLSDTSIKKVKIEK